MSPGSWGQSITRSRLRHSAQLVQLPTRHCIGASGVVMGLPGSVRRPAVQCQIMCSKLMSVLPRINAATHANWFFISPKLCIPPILYMVAVLVSVLRSDLCRGFDDI